MAKFTTDELIGGMRTAYSELNHFYKMREMQKNKDHDPAKAKEILNRIAAVAEILKLLQNVFERVTLDAEPEQGESAQEKAA